MPKCGELGQSSQREPTGATSAFKGMSHPVRLKALENLGFRLLAARDKAHGDL